MSKSININITNAKAGGENSEHFGLVSNLSSGLERIVRRVDKSRELRSVSLTLDVQHKLVGVKVIFEFSDLPATKMYFANWSFLDQVKEKIISEMKYFDYEIPQIEEISEERIYDSIYFTIPIGDY